MPRFFLDIRGIAFLAGWCCCEVLKQLTFGPQWVIVPASIAAVLGLLVLWMDFRKREFLQ